jgi:glycosyltransferase involved in cell wall biosynthesis
MKQKVVILESVNILGGGPKLALEIAEALRIAYEVCFLIPGRGEFAKVVEARGYCYSFFFSRNISRGHKKLSDILRFIFYFPVMFVSSFREIVKLKPEIIFSNATPTFLFSATIGFLLRRPVIWNICNYYQDKKVVFLVSVFGRFPSVKKIIFVSKGLQAQFPGLAYKSVTINPGLDLAKHLKFEKINIRNELGIDKNMKIIIQIGWVTKVKGQHIVIEAAKYVCQKRRDVCFLIIGKNLQGQQWYLQQLKNNIKENKLQDSVKLLGFYEDIKSIFDESFLNVVGSFEGFPLVMLEAGAFKIPTIGPDVGGTGFDIKDGQNGLLYEFGNARDLACKIIYMLEDQRFYESARNNVFGFVKTHTSEGYRSNILSVVDRIMVR